MAERLPFALWWQQVQAQQRAQGLKDDELDETMKYAVEIPGVADVIHVIPRAKVSKDEMAAHRAALRRKLPSPLSARQLDTLKWKLETFKKIMLSPTPPEVRQIGWYINQVENVGDMMTATYWGGKGILWALSKIGLKVRGPLAKYMGWAMVGKDIADMINILRIAQRAAAVPGPAPLPISPRQALFFQTPRGQKKYLALKGGSLNPFSKEMKASRGFKLKAKLPGVPDWIEILQVTDQLFGVGVSFGPIVGFMTDALYGIRRGAEFKLIPRLKKPTGDPCLDGFVGGCGLLLGGP